MEIRTMKTIPPPEIDTKSDDKAHRQGEFHSISSSGISVRDADTPKHCNKGERDMNGQHPSFQSQTYPHYPSQQRAQQGIHGQIAQNGYYHQGSSGHPQSMLVSPPTYNNFYYPSHHNDNSSRPGYPPPPPTYGNQGQSSMQYNGNRNYSSSPYNEMNGRHPGYNDHGAYNQSQNPNSNQGMDFSRAVSSSFAENNKDQHIPPPSFDNDILDQRDDISIGDDASWKNGLYQVASIEEDKFEARQGATTPVDRICSNLSSDISNSTMDKKGTPTYPKKNVLTSIQEPLDMSNHKDALGQLELCSTGSSELLFGRDLASKRERDSRQDTSGPRNMSPPMNFNHLSMREQRDAPPTKRSRTSSIGEDRELYTAFSMESMGSFGREGSKLPDFNNVSDKKRFHASNSKHLLAKEEPVDHEVNDRGLTAGNLSWEIKGQDSFGEVFSVSSNLTENITDDVLGKSFSFGHDEDFPCQTQEQHDGNAVVDLGRMDTVSENMEISQKESFSPNAGRSFSMDSTGHHNHRGPRYPVHPASNRFGLPPPFPNHRNGHGYRHPGPYGMGRPPPSYLPSSFLPPPQGMAGPPMTRTAPAPVYMMTSAHGRVEGMNGMKGSVETGNGCSFNWSKSDDGRLQDLLKKHKNPKDWVAIAKDFGFGRTAKQCNERWIRYLKPGVRKGQWQDHEDAIVIEAVTTCKEQPFTRWSDLAQKLPGRVGKQIRDRWVNHLNPNINHMPFAKVDDMKLWDGHKQLGKRWVEISTKYFNSSRSENHIKNRWYSASFKKFVSNEFGPDAYVPCDKKNGKKGGKPKMLQV